jgi:hypothetical protein
MSALCEGCGEETGAPESVLEMGEVAWHYGCLPVSAPPEPRTRDADALRRVSRAAKSREKNRKRGMKVSGGKSAPTDGGDAA